MYTAARQNADPGRRSARAAAANSPMTICTGTVTTIHRNELNAAVRTMGSWKILVKLDHPTKGFDAPGKYMPVEKADLELAEHGVGGENGVNDERRQQSR